MQVILPLRDPLWGQESPLSRGELSIIAESTPERLQVVREMAPTFASQFRVIQVPPLSERETLPVLLGVLRELETQFNATRIRPHALESVLHLASRFSPHQANPGRSVRLLRAVVAEHAGSMLGTEEVFHTLQRRTGLPRFVLGAEALRPRADVVAGLSAMVAGQPDAVEALADVVMLMQTALADPAKPLATLLFVGPTGVGKTESAKALARYLFGSADRLVRFDMSEMNTADSVARLVGGSSRPDGELALALRAQPHSVVLLDEIEKAHPKIFDALLQLLGEGRLTDGAGRTLDATQAVIVMTSNLGVAQASRRAGFGGPSREQVAAHYLAAVRAFFRPEFFNRLDRVVAFAPLERGALRRVMDLALAELLSRRGVQQNRVVVDAEPALLDQLVEQAFDPRYGARPIKRAMERELTVPLAHHLATRGVADHSLVELFRKDGGLGLAVLALPAASPLPVRTRPAAWDAAELVQRFAWLLRWADAMGASDEVAALRERRAVALRRQDLREVERLAFLDDLQLVRTETQQLAETRLAPDEVLEREVVRGRQDDERRPRRELQHVFVRTRSEVTHGLARDDITDLWRRARLLAYMVAAAARGEGGCRLVLSHCSADADAASMDVLVRCLPRLHGGAVTSSCLEGGAVIFPLPGAAGLMRHWEGFALVPTDADPGRHALLRLQVVDGTESGVSTPPRGRLREQASGGTLGPLVLEPGSELPVVMRHVATGLPARDWWDILTAALDREE